MLTTLSKKNSYSNDFFVDVSDNIFLPCLRLIPTLCHRKGNSNTLRRRFILIQLFVHNCFAHLHNFVVKLLSIISQKEKEHDIISPIVSS